MWTDTWPMSSQSVLKTQLALDFAKLLAGTVNASSVKNDQISSFPDDTMDSSGPLILSCRSPAAVD